MKAVVILFLFLSAYAGFSQGVINNNSYMVLTSGSYIYIDGDGNGGYTNTGTGYINSDGTVSLEGSWINNSTTNIFTGNNSLGSVIFSGIRWFGSYYANFKKLYFKLFQSYARKCYHASTDRISLFYCRMP